MKQDLSSNIICVRRMDVQYNKTSSLIKYMAYVKLFIVKEFQGCPCYCTCNVYNRKFRNLCLFTLSSYQSCVHASNDR